MAQEDDDDGAEDGAEDDGGARAGGIIACMNTNTNAPAFSSRDSRPRANTRAGDEAKRAEGRG
eukprot:scaffold275124_cov17-Prasinocladus_malaysianus.AAC.1